MSLRVCESPSEHGPHDWWEDQDSDTVWTCPGTFPVRNDWPADWEVSGRTRSMTETAMRWALVQFVVALEERKAEDLVNASPENGWLMRSAHDLYDDVIDTLSRLATGSLSASGYLAEEQRKALEPTEPAPPLCTRKGCGRPLSEHDYGTFCP